MTAPTGNVNISVSVPKATADALEKTSEDRMIGKGLIVAKALDAFIPTLPPLNGPVDTPKQAGPPPGLKD